MRLSYTLDNPKAINYEQLATELGYPGADDRAVGHGVGGYQLDGLAVEVYADDSWLMGQTPKKIEHKLNISNEQFRAAVDAHIAGAPSVPVDAEAALEARIEARLEAKLLAKVVEEVSKESAKLSVGGK